MIIMGILSVKDLKMNMVLAEDLRDRSGRLLMTRGTVLTDKYLKICKMWGVIEASIEGVSSEEIQASAAEAFDAAAFTAAAETVDRRFFHTDPDHPAIRELRRLCLLRTAGGNGIDRDNFREIFWFEEEIEDMERKKPIRIEPAKFINAETKLSSLPEIYQQILDAISKPSSSAYDIEQVIGRDTNLTARLLKIVNSAFYGYPSRIDTLSRAVNIVGTIQLSTLAIGVNVIQMFRKIPPDVINMKRFWKHSILCGILARVLAGYKNIQNTERLFVAGLLHDIGRLVLYNHKPREALYALTKARKSDRLLYLTECELFTLDHALIGGLLLSKWQMPMSLEDMVHHHHDPRRAKNILESSIIHLADLLANAMGIGTSGERLIPALDTQAWAQFGLSPNILPLAMEQAERQLEDVFELMYADDTEKPQR